MGLAWSGDYVPDLDRRAFELLGDHEMNSAISNLSPDHSKSSLTVVILTSFLVAAIIGSLVFVSGPGHQGNWFFAGQERHSSGSRIDGESGPGMSPDRALDGPDDTHNYKVLRRLSIAATESVVRGLLSKGFSAEASVNVRRNIEKDSKELRVATTVAPSCTIWGELSYSGNMDREVTSGIRTLIKEGVPSEVSIRMRSASSNIADMMACIVILEQFGADKNNYSLTMQVCWGDIAVAILLSDQLGPRIQPKWLEAVDEMADRLISNKAMLYEIAGRWTPSPK